MDYSSSVHYSPFILWRLQPEVTTVTTKCFGFLQPSLGFQKTLMAHSFPRRALQSRKEKEHRAFFPELRPTALIHVRKTTDLHLLLLNPEKTSECYQRAVRSTDRNKQCPQERKPLGFKGSLGCYVKRVNK